jgi:hypothetical protein
MSALTVQIEGMGCWTPGFVDWAAVRAGLRGEAAADPAAAARPNPALLPAVERRRAPLPVLLACEVAAQACAAATRPPSELASVFASTHGDLVITDYMCSTLATAPRELSPVRFHNSVHNAPAGYWTIAAQCHAASTSISACHASFGAALFEAAVEVHAEGHPILLVAYDTESAGPLQEVSPSRSLFGVALVIAAAAGTGSTLHLQLTGKTVAPALPDPRLPPEFAALAAQNPMAAGALPLLATLAMGERGALRLAAGLDSTLDVEWTP